MLKAEQRAARGRQGRRLPLLLLRRTPRSRPNVRFATRVSSLGMSRESYTRTLPEQNGLDWLRESRLDGDSRASSPDDERAGAIDPRLLSQAAIPCFSFFSL